MPTPHNSANPGDFAKTVLMPGDPLRAKFIADTFLDNARLVNNVRGIHGYTGTYKDVPVSVMASGMGMPSIGIYSYELFTQYGVDNIIYGVHGTRQLGKANMLRLRMPAGVVTKERLAFTAGAIKKYQIPRVHFTTCQTIQLHDLSERDVCEIMEKAFDAGIITRGGGGDFPRNGNVPYIWNSCINGLQRKKVLAEASTLKQKIYRYFNLSRIRLWTVDRV